MGGSINLALRACPETRFRAEDFDFVARNESEAEAYPRYVEAETKFRSPKSESAEPEWGFWICSIIAGMAASNKLLMHGLVFLLLIVGMYLSYRGFVT